MRDSFIKQVKASFISCLLLSYVILTAGLITNVLQLLTLVCIFPLNKDLYRKLNYYLNYLFYANYTFLAQRWSTTNFEIFMKKEDVEFLNKENVVAIANHHYETDWMLGLILCQNLGLLGGTKGFFKNTLKYLPVLGWSWTFAGNIFVKRNWEQDSKTLHKQINSILDFPKGYSYTVVIFCEGTRFTEEKLRKNHEVARSKGFPELKHHLLPRLKGFLSLTTVGRHKFSAVYDCNFVIKPHNNRIPGFLSVVRGEPYHAQAVIRRIPIDTIPTDEEECSRFLNNLYKEKDEIVDKFIQTGDLKNVGIERAALPDNKYDLYLFIAWASILIPALAYFTLNALVSGSFLLNASFLTIILLFNILTKWLIGNSIIEEIKK